LETQSATAKDITIWINLNKPAARVAQPPFVNWQTSQIAVKTHIRDPDESDELDQAFPEEDDGATEL
jgi:predicted RNA binding protein with dsRBD fold (UPF0201 family)